MTRSIFASFIFLALLGASSVQAQMVTVDFLPPSVVKTVPMAGDREVDPGLDRICVTFSKPMQDGTWSWSYVSPETFPLLLAGPEFLSDKKTCCIRVRLEPGRSYAIWINSQNAKNFKDTGNRPAVPYLITFQTRNDSKPKDR